MREFLKTRIKENPGLITTLEKKKIGEHIGLPFYTIGQRKGIEIGGTGPYYVIKKDAVTNTLVVVPNRDDKSLYSRELIFSDVNWISGEEPKLPLECEVRIRYRHPAQKAVIESRIPAPEQARYGAGMNYESRSKNTMIHDSKFLIRFREPQRAVTPGQSAVFYRGKEMLGGGVIEI